MKVVAIVQTRMASTRLPGKVLLDLAGLPMLGRVMSRLRRATRLNDIVLATTTRPTDEVIVQLCREKTWTYFRGSEDDVLDRYYRAAGECQADVVVRITSDCPFVEPSIVDRVIQEFLERQPNIDYASNILPRRTFPRGLDVEVIRLDVLQRAWQDDQNPAWREHVTPYIYRNPQRFRLHGVMSEEDYSEMRWTVDTTEDLVFARRLYEHFGHDCFSWREILVVLQEHPEWQAINRHGQQKVL